MADDDDADGPDSWLVTYADAITLLMAFFVVLLSFSKIDLVTYEAVKSGINENVSGAAASDRPLYQVYNAIDSLVLDSTDLDESVVQVGFDDRGVVVDFASGSFFEPGSTTLKPIAQEFLNRIRRELSTPPFDLFNLDVEGHTDDSPINSATFPSNWDLSAGRAATVVRFYVESGMEPTRLKATGYADTIPKFPNRDVVGNPIAENQAKNRRVTIRIHP